MMAMLCVYYPGVDDPKQIAYLYCNGIDTVPVCRHCGGAVKWFSGRYAKSCSTRCDNLHRSDDQKQAFIDSAKNIDRTKTAKTIAERYGQHPMKGKKHSPRSPEAIEATNALIRKAHLQKYGVDNISQLPAIREKAVATRKANEGMHRGAALNRLYDRVATRLHEHEQLVEVIPANAAIGEANRRYRIRCLTCDFADDYASETFKFRMRTVGRVCSTCCGITTSQSLGENDLAGLFDNPVRNDRKIIRPYELDIVDHTRLLAVEYCGIYWHSEKAGKDRFYHREKLDLCHAVGYRLITVFEDEWLNKRNIVESMVSNALGQNIEKINARSCEVKIIDSKTGNIFIEANHIQGRGRANVYYALYHGGEIVSLMSFSNNDISRRSVGWDINRFCSKLGMNVRGAAGKLFKAFVRDHNPEKVVSYADLRWGTGKVYGGIGFTHISDTLPNYWYFRDNEMKRYHRYGLRKNKEDDPSLTEWDNRQKQGWNRIWDCGHAKWVWESINTM